MTTVKVCERCGATINEGASATRCLQCDSREPDAATNIVDDVTLVSACQTNVDAEGTSVANGQAKPSPKSADNLHAEFGGYQLIEEIARGGMGVIYRARQIQLDRVVALKMILAGNLASEQDVQRFYTEAGAAAKLQHPNIVRIHDVGQVAGQHYFSMDFIEGRSLAEVTHDPALTTTKATRYVKTIADAIHYAHEQGILHRDLKPANVLIDKDDEPQITDFGLAKEIGGDSQLTGTGQILGTPGYMPPEQAAGKTSDAMCRQSDVYSIGAILYELLAGRPPFRADTPLDTLMLVISEDPIPPRELNPNVSRDLDTICQKCLQKDPARRYATAQSLAEELQCVLDGEPIKARPTTTLDRGIRWCKRHPTIAVLVGAVSALIFVLAVGGPLMALKQASLKRGETDARSASALAETRARRSLRLEEQSRVAAQKVEQESQRLLYANDMLLATQAWEGADVGGMLRLLKRHVPKGFATDLRNFEWYYLAGLPFANANSFRHQYPVHALAVSPDGSQLAVASAFEVHLWDLERGIETRVIDAHDGVVAGIDYSRDGQKIVTSGADHGIKLWAVGSGKLIWQIEGHEDVVSSVAFSPDGMSVASCSWDDTVRIWDADSGQSLATISEHTGDVNRVRFSADGKWLATCSHDKTAQLWSTSTGERLAVFEGHHDIVTDVVFSPDDRFLATSCQDGKVRVWSLEKRELLGELSSQGLAFSEVTWAPDGSEIAASCYDNRVYVWDATTRNLKRALVGHVSPLRAVAYTARGRLLSGCFSGVVRFWNSDPSPGHAILQGHVGQVTGIACSPVDRGWLVSCGVDGKVVLWDSDRNLLKATLVKSALPMRGVEFSRNGSILAAAGANGDLTIWDGEALGKSSAPLSIRQCNIGAIGSVSVSSDGKYVAIGGDEGRVLVMDVPSGKTIFDKQVGQRPISSVTFSPDDQKVAWTSWDGGVNVFRFQTGQREFDFTLPVASLHNRKVGVMSPTIDGRSDIWTSLPALKAAYSPQGSELAVLFANGLLMFFDAATGAPLDEILGNGTLASALAFSADGSTLATASQGNALRLVDPKSKSIRGQLRGPEGGVICVAIKADHGTIACGGLDGSIRVWRKATSAELMEHASELLGFTDTVALLSNQIDQKPDDSQLIQRRATLYARSGQWNAAAEDFDRLLKISPEENWLWYLRATVAIAETDVPAYEYYCDELLRQFGSSKDLTTLERTAKMSLVLRRVDVDLEQLNSMIDQTLAQREGQRMRQWFELAKGMVEYRRGDFATAIEWLEQVEDDENNSWAFARAQGRLFLSMAYYQSNRRADANQVYNEALRQLDELIDKDDYGSGWNDAIICQTVAEEVRKMLDIPD